MKSRLLYLLPLVILLWACPGQTENDPEPDTEKACLLQEQLSGAANNQIFRSRFTYNTGNQLTGIAQDSAGVTTNNATLTYDTKNRLAQVTDSRTRYVNEYNQQDQLIKLTRYYKNATTAAYEEQDYYTYSYNSNNDLAEAKYYYSASGTGQLFYIWQYTYTNGDPTKVEQLSAQQNRIALAVITYDDKPAPLPSQVISFYDPLQGPSVHNIRSLTLTDNNGGTSSYNVTYTYNAQELPTAATKTYSSGYEERTSYTYNCQ